MITHGVKICIRNWLFDTVNKIYVDFVIPKRCKNEIRNANKLQYIESSSNR